MLSGAKKHVKNTSKIGDFSYLQHFSGIGRLSASHFHFLKRPRDRESSLSDANLISFMPEFVNFLQALEGLNLGAFYLLPRFLQSCYRDFFTIFFLASEVMKRRTQNSLLKGL